MVVFAKFPLALSLLLLVLLLLLLLLLYSHNPSLRGRALWPSAFNPLFLLFYSILNLLIGAHGRRGLRMAPHSCVCRRARGSWGLALVRRAKLQVVY